MLLNLNNCSVLKPQGYSSLQSISETEWYELKNILTFVFCWVEKLFSFGPLHIIQCVEKASALVLLKGEQFLTWDWNLSQFHQTKAMAPKHIPTSNKRKQRIISLPSPHVHDKGLCWWFFLSSGEGRTGTSQQKPSSPVLLVLARPGSAGTFWGKHWAFCRQTWHSKTWIWSWTQPNSWKDHLNPSQQPCHKVKIFY